MALRALAGRPAWKGLALGALTGLSACAAEVQSGDGFKQVGSLGLTVEPPASAALGPIDYDISGSGVHRTGQLGAAGAPIQELISGLLAGRDYLIILQAADKHDPNVRCDASLRFDIAAFELTLVKVVLHCQMQPRAGAAEIDGTINVCPAIDALTISPALAKLGRAVALSAAVTDDGSPAALRYSWSSSSGRFAQHAAADTLFTCAAAGKVQLKLTVDDGYCRDSATTELECLDDVELAPSVAGSPRSDAGETSPEGGYPSEPSAG